MTIRDEIIQRCQREGTPLKDSGRAIFIWIGDSAPRLMGDFSGWEEGQSVDLEPIGEGLWAFTLELPDDAYMEYIFIGEDGERLLDPFNRRKTPNGMGKTNQYFYMPQGKPTAWQKRHPGTPTGTLHHAEIATHGFIAGGKRTVHFYQPPVEQPVPLMVVWDGGDYLRRAKLVTIIENLLAAGRIGPIALAMPENGGPARTLEYACSEATLGFLLSSLLPEARSRLHLIDPAEVPGAYGVLGASLGGLMALYTGLRLPQLFGKVLAQSGAYRIDGYEFVTGFLVEHGPRPEEMRIWMDAGRYEDLLEASREMHGKLTAKAYPVEYREYPAGHNYPAWRDDLPAGLEYLFGGAAAARED